MSGDVTSAKPLGVDKARKRETRIMGKMEEVHRGDQECHRSSEEGSCRLLVFCLGERRIPQKRR